MCTKTFSLTCDINSNITNSCFDTHISTFLLFRIYPFNGSGKRIAEIK